MNPIIMHVASGMSLFSGSAMIVMAVGLALTGKRWWLRPARGHKGVREGCCLFVRFA